ncbi:MAG: rhodanese-like domain-containing protein [Gemmatimonadota bacterium]
MIALPSLIPPGQLEGLLAELPDLRVLDVRTPGEYEGAHIVGAYNVPLDTLGEHAREIRSQVTVPVILVCQSGSRARRAEDTLKAAGMPNLHVLEGGMNAWLAAGHAVRRTRARMSLERQVRIVAGALVAVGAFLALGLNPWFAVLPALVGSGLVFSGVTDTCTLGLLLTRLPYNRPASCDVGAMVAALTAGLGPVPLQREARRVGGGQASCAS